MTSLTINYVVLRKTDLGHKYNGPGIHIREWTSPKHKTIGSLKSDLIDILSKESNEFDGPGPRIVLIKVRSYITIAHRSAV